MAKKNKIAIGNMFPSLHDNMVKCYQRGRYRQTLWSPITLSEVKKGGRIKKRRRERERERKRGRQRQRERERKLALDFNTF